MSKHFRQIPEAAVRPALVPSETRLGPVHIGVTDARTALPVWRDLVGLTLLSQDEKELVLGAGNEPLIVLHVDASRPVAPRTSGLYHVAIHVPKRKDLALAIARLFSAKYRNAPTDHLVTETTYLWDADNNGIELTFETPERGVLVADTGDYYGLDAQGRRHSGRERIDLGSMFAELKEGESLRVPLPKGTRIGHVHLHVDSLDKAMAFYTDVIGFEYQMLGRGFGMADVTLDYPPHILAFNTWNGEGAPQASPEHAGLRWFTIEVPSQADLDAMKDRLAGAGAPLGEDAGVVETVDPAGNRVRISAAN
ncbi:MAG: VOC family protein [Bauldia sp.]